jgi:hypothetical protein
MAASLIAPARGDVRIIMRQSVGGKPLRISRGAPPNGTSMGKIFQIHVFQEGRAVPVEIHYDKAIWSGLSWGVGEVKGRDLKGGVPMTVRGVSLEEKSVDLKFELYVVHYR